MGEIQDVALQAFDLITQATQDLKGRLSDTDAALLDDLLELQSWAHQVSYGERVSLERGRMLISKIIEISRKTTV